MTKEGTTFKQKQQTLQVVAMFFFQSFFNLVPMFQQSRSQGPARWKTKFKMADEEVKRVKDLMAKKNSIEEEIKELNEVLESVSLNYLLLAHFYCNCYIFSSCFHFYNNLTSVHCLRVELMTSYDSAPI